MTSYKVRFVHPERSYRSLKEELDAAYLDCMESGDLIAREHLDDFEDAFAAYVGTEFAVGVNSGYDALHLSLRALGVGEGDEVIVPAHTFVASASAVVNAGAKPVLVDVRDDYNVDPDAVEEAVTDRTAAIMPVHLNGRMAGMDRILEIAEDHDLAVVEDACQSLGATFDGKTAGACGQTGCWSFYPFKILGAFGDGGAITTDDDDIARYATRMRFNGEDRRTGRYHGHGFTCLLDNLQAALLNVKLPHMDDWIARRREIAATYRDGLEDIGDLDLPHWDDPRYEDVYQNYVVRTPRRDALADHLEDQGVEVLIHWGVPYYRHEDLGLDDQGPFPETDAISDEVLSLPMNPDLQDDEVRYVIDVVRDFYG